MKSFNHTDLTIITFRFVVSLLLPTFFVPFQVMALVAPYDKVVGKKPSELDIASDLLPDVSSAQGILMSKAGIVLWERDADSSRPIAGLNAIMAAIVALESDLSFESELTLSSGDAGAGSKDLKKGDTLTFEDLIITLLMRPTSHSARLVANEVAGDEKSFVGLMNAKAQELNLSKTHFSNVFGSDDPGNYSSARDIANLSRYAMQDEVFAKAAGTKMHSFSVKTSQGSIEERQIINTNSLLWKNEFATGVKGGISDEAGYVLSASALQDKVSLFAVVLGTELDAARFSDIQEIFDFGFAHFRRTELAVKGTLLAEVPVSDYLKRSVNAGIGGDVSAPVLDLGGEITRSIKVSKAQAPIKKGDELGVVSYFQDGKLIATAPLVSHESLAKPFILFRPFYWIINTFKAIF